MTTPRDLAEMPLLVHVGLHKCASTWLQNNLFANESLGFCAPWKAPAPLAVEAFVTSDPVSFDPIATREAFARAWVDPSSDRSVPVLSHEAMSSRPQHGRYHAPYAAQKIKKVFPNARLLLIFREQKKLFYSLYGEHIRNGGRETPLGFFGDADNKVGFAPICRREFFLYDRLIDCYRDMFGEDRVLALPLEALKADPDDFVRRICAFVGAPPVPAPPADPANTGWSAGTYALAASLNGLVRRRPDTAAGKRRRALLQRALWRLDRAMPRSWSAGREARIRERIGRVATGYYAESNGRTASMTGFDLGAMGYET
jgi:hypothetical protein